MEAKTSSQHTHHASADGARPAVTSGSPHAAQGSHQLSEGDGRGMSVTSSELWLFRLRKDRIHHDFQASKGGPDLKQYVLINGVVFFSLQGLR